MSIASPPLLKIKWLLPYTVSLLMYPEHLLPFKLGWTAVFSFQIVVLLLKHGRIVRLFSCCITPKIPRSCTIPEFLLQQLMHLPRAFILQFISCFNNFMILGTAF